jgi:predicted nucleotide-binding protein (sugar kinase/HSP70/actin superfamily)
MEKNNNIKKISFPHMGNYFYALKPLALLLADEVIMPPPITKKTIELGTKHSPESACIPFKYNLGNFIEALDLGANILVQSGGGCRFGYYGEVQENILKNLGYKFEFLKFVNDFSIIKISKYIKLNNPELSYFKIFKTILFSYLRVRLIDKIEAYLRMNIGFEVKNGDFERNLKLFLNELDKSKNILDLSKLKKKYLEILKNIPTKKPQNPIRVGIVGELYVLMEPFSNFNIEKELGRRGIEVHRFCSVSSILHDIFTFDSHTKSFLKHAAPYLKYHIGAHGTESVGLANKLRKQGFDGIIHVKPFGCMPEVNAMSALHRMAKEHNFPILYFSFDSQTSETGIKTRIEAFYDMLMMKKKRDTMQI